MGAVLTPELLSATESVYASAHRDEAAKSGAIYGGVAGGMSAEADEFIRAVMADMMDQQASIPPA